MSVCLIALGRLYVINIKKSEPCVPHCLETSYVNCNIHIAMQLIYPVKPFFFQLYGMYELHFPKNLLIWTFDSTYYFINLD